jgi:hypothetical protein
VARPLHQLFAGGGVLRQVHLPSFPGHAGTQHTLRSAAHMPATAVAVLRRHACQELTGKPQQELSHLLHCRALGSYVRGKPDAGDVGACGGSGPAQQQKGQGMLSSQ